MTEQDLLQQPHYWSRCPMCGPVVMCGKCGNNSCNAGYGTLSDGSTCDACRSAYDMQDKSAGLPLWGWLLIGWIWTCHYARMLRPHYLGWLIWKWRGMPEPRPWWTFRS